MQNFDVPCTIHNIPVLFKDIVSPKGVRFDEKEFIEIMRNLKEGYNSWGKKIVDGYWLNDALKEKTEPAFMILEIIENEMGFFLRIGVFKQSEAGRMMRNFLNNDKMKLVVCSQWDVGIGKVTNLKFGFIKEEKS